MKPKTIVYLYNQLEDAIIQSNIFLYIKDIGTDKGKPHQFAIVTFELKETLQNKEKLAGRKAELAAMNITWYPRQYHQGTSLLLKIIDFMSSFYQITMLRFSGYRHIVSLGSVAGSYAYLFSLFLGMRLYLYQYEPHSEYEADSGTYTKESVTFKILNTLEKRAAFFASVISSGTHHMLDRLTNWKVKADFFKIPSVVNEQKFIFSESDRNEIRKKHGIENDKTVIYYPGKFGGLYYKRETIEMFGILLNKNSDFHALVVTPNDLNEIMGYFKSLNIDPTRYTVTKATYNEIHQYNAAADFAVIAAPPGPSKKFVSNIKVGEYLCSGLPYLISKGISEDDEYAVNYRVGVVVKDFSESEITGAYEKIMQLLSEPAEQRRRRCREVGIDYRGFTKLNQEFRNAIQALHSK